MSLMYSEQVHILEAKYANPQTAWAWGMVCAIAVYILKGHEHLLASDSPLLLKNNSANSIMDVSSQLFHINAVEDAVGVTEPVWPQWIIPSIAGVFHEKWHDMHME